MATVPLFTKLAEDADHWRKSGYACGEYPLIGEILAWQKAVERLRDMQPDKFRYQVVYATAPNTPADALDSVTHRIREERG